MLSNIWVYKKTSKVMISLLLAAAVLSAALARELALTKKGVEEAWNLSFER